MIFDLGVLATTASHVIAATDTSDDNGVNFALVFLLSGFIFYGYVFFRYRNADKRHHHESETEANLHNVRQEDRHVKTLTGLSNSQMSGANNHDVRGSLRKFF